MKRFAAFLITFTMLVIAHPVMMVYADEIATEDEDIIPAIATDDEIIVENGEDSSTYGSITKENNEDELSEQPDLQENIDEVYTMASFEDNSDVLAESATTECSNELNDDNVEENTNPIIFEEDNLTSICFSASQEIAYGDYKYSDNGDGTVTITGPKDPTGTIENPVIPSSIDGKTVTGISTGAFNGYSGLSGSLTLPNTLIEIGDYAFKSCINLNGPLNIPEGVTYIGKYSFYECKFSGNLNIPDRVMEIGDYAFYYCSYFDGTLHLPSGITEILPHSFHGCSGITGDLTIPDGVIKIGKSAFENDSGYNGKLTLPDGVRIIDDYAFYGCNYLRGTLNLTDNLSYIGKSAFYTCSNLTGGLFIPDSVETIGGSAFYRCSGLSGRLSLPNGLKTIESETFSGCSNLVGELMIPESVTVINDSAFSGCISLSGDLVIPDTVRQIGESAFSSCKGFNGELIISDHLKILSDKVFYYCSNLSGELIIPDGVVKIGKKAFFECNGLTGDLYIPDSVTTVGGSAFQYCSGFDGTLKLSNSMTDIGSECFSGCSGLKGDLVIPQGVTSIGGDAFNYCNGFAGKLVIADSVAYLGGFTDTGLFRRDAFYCYNISQIINKSTVSIDALDFLNNDYEYFLSDTGDIIQKDGTMGKGTFIRNGDIRADGVSLNIINVDLEVGNTVTLRATITPSNVSNRSVEWISSDESVATVTSRGVVRGISAGEATITVRTEDGGFTAECVVTVSGIGVKRVSLNITKETIEKGGTLILKETIQPANAQNKNVTWESSDPDIATVGDDGTVTGVYPGEAVITVTTEDGGKTASCKITVTPIAVTGVVLDRTAIDIKEGYTVALGYSITPENADNKNVTWKSSDTGVATVTSEGTVKGITAGTATITCTATDGSGKSATCIITVKPVLVTSVKLNKTSANIDKGKTVTLTPIITPSNAANKKVTWKSSNTKVATVTLGGVVKGIAVGTSIITVTTEDGGKTDSCTIVVEAPTTPTPRKISIKDAKIKLSKTTYTYSGKACNPAVKEVVVGGKALKEGTDYSVSRPAISKDAGDYTITLTGKGIYIGTSRVSYTIKKAKNTLEVSGKTVSVSTSKIKDNSRALSAKKCFKVSKKNGKVTYKKTKGNKKITVAENGKVTIASGLKKGKYNVKVKVTAAGDKNYKKASKTVTVTLRIK